MNETSSVVRDVRGGESLRGTSRRHMLLGATAAMGSAWLLPGCGFRSGGVPGPALAPSPGDIWGTASLRCHAAASGLLAGFAVVPWLLRNNATYAAIVQEQANLIVAENAMKWESLRPSATTYNFDSADVLLSFAEQGRMKIRGHNLLWHRQLPAWFSSVATQANARQLLESHIETVAGRYAGRMHSWDVVNEAIQVSDGRPDGLRDSPWLRLVGDDYVEVAFRAARKADPQALLTYNDYGIEAENAQDEAKRQAVLLMLRRMRTRRVPIDAVGVQSHISAGAKYGAGLMRFITSVRELDLQVFVTEMDVNDRNLGSAVEERDAAVAQTYHEYLHLVLSHPAVTAVVFWGVSDRDTWLNHEDSRADGRPERPLLFDANLKPKQDVFAVRNAFDRRTGSKGRV